MSEKRNTGQAVKRGFLCRCPNCGEGRLFRKFLKVADECPACHETLRHHRADDAPAYLVILIVGHIVVPLALLVEKLYQPPHWLAFSIWLPLTLVMSLALLQPIKGAVVGWQWAQRMHGFDPNHVDEIELMKDAR
jgi:uncharacterized protein (DUF983 family)